MLSIVILARLLAPADFGLLAMVMAIVGIGELLRDFGLSVAAIQAEKLTSDEKSNLFWLNSFVGVALAVIVFFSAWPVAILYDDPRLVGITQAVSATFIISGLATQFKAQINRDLRFVALGVTEAVPQALGLAAAIAIAMASQSYWALVAQVVLSACISLFLCVALAGWRPSMYQRDVPIGRFIRFSGPLVGTQCLAYLSKNVDTVILGALKGPTELGAYNRAYQIVLLPLNQVTAPLSRVAIPVLSKLQTETESLVRYLKTAQFATIVVTSVFYGAMIGFGEPLVDVMLGDQWSATVPLLQILAVSGIFRALSQVPYWIFVTQGRTGKQLVIYMIGQPVIIGAIAIGAYWGGVGVATGCSIGYAAFWVLNMWWAGRVTGLPTGHLAWSGLAIVSIFAVPIGVIGYVSIRLISHGPVALGIGIAVAMLWTAAALCVIPRYRAEVVRFVRLARSRRKRE